MTSCPKARELLLRGSLDGDVAAHLETCDACRGEAESLEGWKGAVAAWDPSRGSSVVSPSRVEALVRAAEARAAGAPREARRRFVVWTSAAAAACAAAVFAIVISGRGVEPTVRIVETGPGQGTVVAAGGDRIGMDVATRVAITESVVGLRIVELERGRIAVAARKRAGGPELVVRAGGVSVHVTGTRFSVARRPEERDVRVALEEGGVRIVDPHGQAVFLAAGSSFVVREGAGEMRGFEPEDAAEIEALLSGGKRAADRRSSRTAAPVEPAEAELHAPSTGDVSRAPERAASRGTPGEPRADERLGVDDARRLILEGRIEEARAALEAAISESPGDAEAWTLLATCHRKLGLWEDAVRAFGEAARLGSARQSGQARYNAAAVLQDKLGRPAPARVLLEEYVRGPADAKPLEQKALLRLVQVDLALGDPAAARAAWEALRRSCPGTEEEKRAAALVEEK